MTCPFCQAKDMFAVYRIRRRVEYRLIDTKKPTDQTKPYKGGSWRLDSDDVGDRAELRCNKCDATIGRGDLGGQEVSDYSIDLKKGVTFMRSFSFFGTDEEVREKEDKRQSALRKHGVGIGSDDARIQQSKRKKEITGILDDLGLDDVDIRTIADHIKENYIK